MGHGINALAALALFSGGAATGWLALCYFSSRGRRAWYPPIQTANPHEGWNPGDKQPCPFGHNDMVALDPADLGAGQYPLVISTVVPRPIAFVSSLSADGVANLAPFSYFNAVAHDPPHVVVSICRSGARSGGKKDTLANIEATGEFVVCIISEWFIEAANHTCGNYDADVDEMQLSGLTPIPSTKVKPPRVQESAVHMECKLKHQYDINNREGKPHTSVVIGEVVLFHIHKGVLGQTPRGNRIIDFSKYQPMSRLGGNTYGRTTSTFDLPRPDRDWQFKKRQQE
eukprot:evm.model.scf_418.4 EVM.evm.TU.scf_418.4   scf_418:26217-29133(+)